MHKNNNAIFKICILIMKSYWNNQFNFVTPKTSQLFWMTIKINVLKLLLIHMWKCYRKTTVTVTIVYHITDFVFNINNNGIILGTYMYMYMCYTMDTIMRYIVTLPKNKNKICANIWLHFSIFFFYSTNGKFSLMIYYKLHTFVQMRCTMKSLMHNNNNNTTAAHMYTFFQTKKKCTPILLPFR